MAGGLTQRSGGYVCHLGDRSMKRVRTHRFNGVKYDIDIDEGARVEGLCDDPVDPTPSVRIYVDLSTRAGFETALHEAMHAALWQLSEADVTRAASEIANFLWRLGYRRHG